MRFTQLSLRHLFGLLTLGAGAFAANGCGASIVVIDCDEGLELCDQKCVDLDSNEDHCGDCNAPCEGKCVFGECDDGPQPCEGPDCQPACEGGLTSCSGVCVDLQTDAYNCGDCFKTCANVDSCRAGVCSEVCACDRCDVIELPSQTDVTQTGTTTGGPDHASPSCNGAGSPDIAARFVAPTTGQYVFDTTGSAFDSVLTLSAACSEIVCVDDTDQGTHAYTSIFLEAGQEIIAVVEGYGGASGNYTLHVYLQDDACVGNLTDCGGTCVDTSSDPSNCGGCFIPCNANEFCSDFSCQCAGPGCDCELELCGSCGFVADFGSTLPTHFSGSTEGLPDDLQPTCVGSTGSEALHLFFAQAEGTYTFDTLGSGFDTVLTVLDAASCGEQACNDDFSNLDSQVMVDLLAGQQVIISVDGLGSAGFYNLNVNYFAETACGEEIGNDVPVEIEGSTIGLPSSFSAPCAPSEAGDQTFSFVAPQTRSYLFDTAGSDFDTVLSVLDGECGGTVLGCNDDNENGSAARLQLDLFAGQLVTVVVDGFSESEGNYRLLIQ